MQLFISVEAPINSFESILCYFILSNPFYCQRPVEDCDLAIITTGSSSSVHHPSITTSSIVSTSNAVLPTITITTTSVASSEMSILAGGITVIMFLLCVIIFLVSLLYMIITKNVGNAISSGSVYLFYQYSFVVIACHASFTEHDKRYK